jgi:GMP synthase-like glutamine amidotransferase
MRLCILEADRPADALLGTHGTYADMFERWLAPYMQGTTFERVFVAGGEELPGDPCRYDGYLVTGARAGVYEDHSWIAPLSTFLRAAAAAQRPVGGVCFGHQIMAQAFGGAVQRSDVGWVVGRHAHDLMDEAADIFGPGPLSVLSFHRDQVVMLPPAARRLLKSAMSPNGGLIYDGFPAISVQFHPEFAQAYVHDLLVSAAGIRVPDDRVGPALASLSVPLDSDRVAQGFARFFQSHVAVRT